MYVKKIFLRDKLPQTLSPRQGKGKMDFSAAMEVMRQPEESTDGFRRSPTKIK